MALVDRYQRIVARSLLDGVNPATLQHEFPVIEHLVQRGVTERDADERTARYRVGPDLRPRVGLAALRIALLTVCGIDEEPNEAHSAHLLALEEAMLDAHARPRRGHLRPPET